MERINYLDHGFVELVSVLGNDDMIVSFARSSFGHQEAFDNAKKNKALISYLIEHHHTSPLEAGEVVFNLKMPIFVARQHVRHRTACLAGETELDFIRPCDGKRYAKTVDDIYDIFTRSKDDNFGADAHKERVQNMSLRSLNEASLDLEHVGIEDIWISGIRDIYEFTLADGASIRCTQDHKIFTENGWMEIGRAYAEGVPICCLRNRGSDKELFIPETDLENETWLPIEGYENYAVSNMGRVKTLTGWSAGIKAQTIVPSGRLVVSLSKNGISRRFQVHTLVMNAFVCKRPEGKECRHINGNQQDNRLVNLAWGTHSENVKDKIRLDEITQNRFTFIEIADKAFIRTDKVYDITVSAPNHNFLVNKGIVVHNCLNELSMRYQEAPEHFYVPELEHICLQDAWNKQGSGEPLKPHVAEAMQGLIRDNSEEAWRVYQTLLNAGVSKETARMALPVNWYTQMAWKMDLKNFLHYCRLRNDGHAQYEIREMARIMEELVRPYFPMVFEAFDEFVRGATTFSRGEMEHLMRYELEATPNDVGELVEIASNSLGSKRRGRELYKKLGYHEEDMG